MLAPNSRLVKQILDTKERSECSERSERSERSESSERPEPPFVQSVSGLLRSERPVRNLDPYLNKHDHTSIYLYHYNFENDS